MINQNTLVVGETQQGKSTLVLNEDLIPNVKSRQTAIFLFDPHDTLVERLGQWCTTMGHGSRLVVDRLDDMHHVFSFGLIERSKNPDPEERLFEHQMLADDTLELLASWRKDYDVNSAPNVKKWTLNALMAWLENDHEIPLKMLPHALMPPLDRNQTDSPYHRILSGVRDPLLRRELSEIRDLPVSRRDEIVGGALRLKHEMWKDLPTQKRMQPTADLGQFIRDKGIYCLQGGRASRRSKSVVMRMIGMRVIRTMMNAYFSGIRDWKAKLYYDEAANFGLIGLTEATAMGMTTKMGLTFTTITQALNFSEEVFAVLMANTPRKIALKCASPTSRLIADQMRFTLDLMREHYTETSTKQRHAGFEMVGRTGKSVARDGASVRETESVTDAPIAIYEDVEETRTHYVPIPSQDMLNEGTVQGQTRGQCKVMFDGRLFDHRFRDWEDPGVFPGYSRKKLERHLQHLRESGILRTPAEVQYEQWMPPPPISARPKGSARTPKGPPGMIG